MTQQKNKYLLSQIAGMNLKRILKEKGITQESFAASYGVNVRTVRRWIKNGIDSVDLVSFVADELNVSFWDMLSDESDVSSVLYALLQDNEKGYFMPFSLFHFCYIITMDI